MNRTVFLVIFLAVCFQTSTAQTGAIHSGLQLLAGYNGPGNVPFWMRSNQFGSIPPPGASMGLIGSMNRAYDASKNHLADWGFSAEGRLNIGNPTNFILIEGYGKLRLSVFELKAGRTRDITGLCDTVLTSGSFSISGNAPGIPKIQLAIPEFYTLPFLGRLFAFKGNFQHGWMGNWYLNGKAVPNTPTYLHQLTLYGRFGKPSWRLKLYGGFNHQVIWGNEKNFMGEDYALNEFQTYLYVISGKAYNHGKITSTRIGDHLGSIDLGLGYEFTNVRLLIYRQNFYDAGALYYLANILDGLNGLSLVNKKESGNKIQWKRMLVEFLYTKNQAGETWSPYTASPYEDYYNNGYYKAGWSYKNVGLGTPFISPANSLKDGFPSAPDDFFGNNRVIAAHLGIEASVCGWNMRSKVSYSRNYGTYGTSATGKAYPGSVYPSPYGVFSMTRQFSAYLETTKSLTRGIQISVKTAFDIGNLYNNSFGLMGGISKSF
jgi:hypothetical protein